MENIATPYYEEIVAHHLRYFVTIGVLSHRADDWDKTNLNFFRKALLSRWPSLICPLNILIFYTMFLGYGIRILVSNEPDFYFICEMIVVQGVTLRYYLFYLKRKDLAELVQVCKKLWQLVRADEMEMVRGFERKVHYLRCFFLWNGIIAVTFYLTTAMTIRLPPKEINGTERRILPFKFYVDVQNEPWYTLATLLQLLVSYIEVVIMGGIETVNPFLIMVSCGYLKVIRKRLYAMRDDEEMSIDGIKRSEDAVFSRLAARSCIVFHQKVIMFCNEINRFADGIFLVQIVSTVYNAALIGLKLLERDPNMLKQLSILALSLLQFFSCQWIPEHLLNESEKIANAAYAATLTHRRYDRRANQMLRFTILRAQRPLQMKAGAFFRLSLENFKELLTSAGSFFTVLRSFSQ